MPRTTLHRLRLALLGAGAVALVLVALGGAANGGNFILGQANTATATTSLSGNTPGPQLKVVNANTSNHTILAQAGGGTGIALYGQHTTTTGAGPALRGDSASTAAGAFSLYGLLSASAPGSPSAAIRAESKSTSANGYGLWATQAGSGIGVYATSPNGTGVLGKHTGGANTGTGPGVEGDSASPENAGVIGKNTAGGPGLQAIVTNNTVAPLKVNSAAKVPSLNADLLDGLDSTNFVRNNPPITLTGPGGEDVLTAKNTGNGRGLAGFSDTWQGVYGHSNSNAGVVGEATNFDGVWGQAHLPTTAGVSGHNYAGGYGVSGDATGNGTGVYATSDSGDAVQAISASGVGVRGTSTSCCSVGVYGFSTGHVGVYGVGNVGVVGVSEGTGGEAGSFSGHVTITRGLTVTDARGCTGCTGGGAKFVRGASSFTPGPFATLQAENATGFGEAGWLRLGDASNPTAVLSLIKQATGTGDFLKCLDESGGPSYTQKCHINKDGTFVGGADFAESLPVRGDKARYSPGDVLSISTKQAGAVVKSQHARDRALIGVYSTRPAVLGADRGGITRVGKEDVPVAITGIVPVKVTTEQGAIRPGDLLTSSSIPGRAMNAGRNPAVGTVLGKALGFLGHGQGVVRMLVMPR